MLERGSMDSKVGTQSSDIFWLSFFFRSARPICWRTRSPHRIRLKPTRKAFQTSNEFWSYCRRPAAVVEFWEKMWKNDIVLIFDRSLVVYVFHFQCFPNVRRSPRPWKKRKVLRSVDPLVAVLQVLVGLLVVREKSTVRPTVLWKRSSYSCNSKGVRQVGI